MRLLLVRALLVAAVVALAGCDHATKYAAKAELEGAQPKPVIGDVVRLDYVENRDTGFGLLRWIEPEPRLPIILALQSLGAIVLAVALLRRRALDLYAAAFALVLAGALGNLTDRLLRGYVVDFIRVPYWPVFNLADIWITAGLGLLVLAYLGILPRRRAGAEAQP
ncbi:MAG: signal peptidase II [Proteobacteria bacterium]|jgi:signal peptidase II|nr:signal peptidase II [Pseudomonadota bacterium]